MKILFFLIINIINSSNLDPSLNTEYEIEKIDQPFEKLDLSLTASSYETTKIYLSDYERLMAIGNEFNQQSNIQKGLIEEEEKPDDFSEFKDKLEEKYEYKLGFFDMMIDEENEIQEEMDDFIQNLDRIEISIPECLEVMGFKEYFDKIQNDQDFKNPVYQNKYFDLSISVHSFRFNLINAFQGLKMFMHFDKFVANIFKPMEPLYNIEDPDPVTIDEIQSKFQQQTTELFQEGSDRIQMILNSFQFFENYTLKLKDTLDEFKTIDTLFNPIQQNEERKIL